MKSWFWFNQEEKKHTAVEDIDRPKLWAGKENTGYLKGRGGGEGGENTGYWHEPGWLLLGWYCLFHNLPHLDTSYHIAPYAWHQNVPLASTIEGGENKGYWHKAGWLLPG